MSKLSPYNVAMQLAKKNEEIDRLRKALEEVQQTVLYTDVSSAETLGIVYRIVNQALEPAKGEDEKNGV